MTNHQKRYDCNQKPVTSSTSSSNNPTNNNSNMDSHIASNENTNCSQTVLSQTQSIENSGLKSSEGFASVSDETVEDVYKMTAHGKRGQRSPTRIEFDLLKRKTKKNKRHILFSRRKSFHECRCREKRAEISTNDIRKNSENVPTTSKYNKIANASQQIKNKMKKTFTGFHTPANSQGIEFNQSKAAFEDEFAENIEIYYFDHGNAAYFRTTDCPPHIISEVLLQQTNFHATRFWAEIYGSINIGVAFLIAFILQTYRFILYSTIRPLIVGFLQMSSDYFIKPTLTIIFNGMLQPPMILFYNIFSSICDMCEPIAKTLGHFLKPIADVLKEIRLIEIKRNCECKIKNQKESV